MSRILSQTSSNLNIGRQLATADETHVHLSQKSKELSLTVDIHVNQGVSNGRITAGSIATTEDSASRPRFMLYVINSFDPERYEALSEIPIIIREIGDEDDNYVARFADANVNASGDSPREAIANLKSALLAKFEYFSSLPSRKLGPEPRRQLAVLKSCIRRKR